MSSRNSIHMIQALEEKVTLFSNRFKDLKKNRGQLIKENTSMKETIDSLKARISGLEKQVRLLSIGKGADNNNWDSETLKKYLDEVIQSIEQNINLLK